MVAHFVALTGQVGDERVILGKTKAVDVVVIGDPRELLAAQVERPKIHALIVAGVSVQPKRRALMR
ncbi:MAG TPA: hypothetical protein ENJ18_15825 [Nannocystis exedens]|nr:hypothetical protein [Nannocystis exedens]